MIVGMKNLLSLLLVTVLAFSLAVEPACNTAQFVQEFDQYSAQVVPALNAILAILQFFGVQAPVGIQAKVGADVSAAQTLVADFANASAAAQPTVRAQITASEGVLNQDLESVFVVANVKDAKSQTKVKALVALVQAAISEGFAIIPQATSKADMAAASASGGRLLAKDFPGSFNAILTAKTGNPGLDKLTPTLKLKGPDPLVRVLRKVIHFVTFGKVA